MSPNEVLYSELVKEIKDAYEAGITMEAAEKLAGKFLYGQIQVSSELLSSDLDARMRKSGTKAIKSAVRTEELKKHEKKPTEGFLEDVVNLSELVQGEQERLDTAEVYRDYLQNLLSIFKDAHIHFRSVAKGRFE